MLSYLHADVISFIKFITLVHIAACSTRDLYFNSYNCDESPRRVTEDKSYVLKWTGKTDPPPCSFNFTAGDYTTSYQEYELCFESENFDLSSSRVKVHITDKSNTWIYDKYVYSKEKTCKEKVKDLSFWLELDNAYVESKALLMIKITASKIVEPNENSHTIWNTFQSILTDTIPVIIIGIILFFVCKNRATAMEYVRSIKLRITRLCENKHESRISRRASLDLTAVDDSEPRVRDRSSSITSSSSSDIYISMETNDTEPPPYPANNCQEVAIPYAPPPSYDDIFKDRK